MERRILHPETHPRDRAGGWVVLPQSNKASPVEDSMARKIGNRAERLRNPFRDHLARCIFEIEQRLVIATQKHQGINGGGESVCWILRRPEAQKRFAIVREKEPSAVRIEGNESKRFNGSL